MSNIHGLGEYQNQNNVGGGNAGTNMLGMGQAGPQEPLDPEAQQALGMFGGLAGGSGRQDKDPRSENFWDMWKYSFCPDFKVVSFPFVIFLLNSTVYVIELIWTAASQYGLSVFYFLGPQDQIMRQMQDCYPYGVQQGQIWRLFTALFLSRGFSDFCLGSVLVLILGFIIQANVGWPKLLLLYMLAGIGGNLMSITCRPLESTVGPLPAVMGLNGALISAVIVNWMAFTGAAQQGRCCLLVLPIMIFIFVLIGNISENATSIIRTSNTLGNVGGFFTGIFAGLFLMPTFRAAAAEPKSFEKKVKLVGQGALFLWYLIFILVFYLSVITYKDSIVI